MCIASILAGVNMSLSMVCFMSQPSTMCLRSLNRFAHRHALCLYWSTRRNIKQGENKYMGPARTWYRKMSMLCCQMDVCKYSRQLSKDPRHASAFGRDWKALTFRRIAICGCTIGLRGICWSGRWQGPHFRFWGEQDAEWLGHHVMYARPVRQAHQACERCHDKVPVACPEM